MIEIEYNLLLAELMGRNRQTVDVGDSIPLAQLEAKLGLPEDSVGMLLINGVWAPLDSVVKDGDFVQLYPHMEGG